MVDRSSWVNPLITAGESLGVSNGTNWLTPGTTKNKVGFKLEKILRSSIFHMSDDNISVYLKENNLLVSGQRSGEPLSNLSNAKRLDSKSGVLKFDMFRIIKNIFFF